MIKARGVVHFTIPVTDTNRSRDFYCRWLGMKVLRDIPDRGMVFLDAGGDCVILAKVDKPLSTAGARDVHHAFLVDPEAYRAALAELKAGGVKFLYDEDRRDGVIDGPRAYFEDPDGNVLEIIDLARYAGAVGG
jgi:catechol 2,3-dioxygenase-like lactoylglutathione lyase family enzyme